MTSRAWTAGALSLLIYTLITLVLGRDVLTHLGTSIVNDPGDPLLTAAILKWNATHVPLTDSWYQFPIFFPTRDTLTFSEHLLGISVIASPIYWVTRDAVVTYNLTLLLTYPLCGIAMFALVHRLTGSAAGAFVAGLAFAFAPYRVSQLPHIQMLAAFWAPLALLGLHAYLETGKRWWLALYGVTWMLQGAANGYALVFFSLLVGLWTLWFVVLRGRWHALAMIAVATVIALVPLAPVLYKYATVHAYYGFVRSEGEIRAFSADIAAVLCAPPSLTFWGWLRVLCLPEGELFPGAALMVLSMLGLVWMFTRAWQADAARGIMMVSVLRWLLLAIAASYLVVILVLLVSGPFMFEIGPLHVSASGVRKPIEVAGLSLFLALVLSAGVRDTLKRAPVIGFYLLSALLTWALALGPTLVYMGKAGRPGPFRWLMALPGMDSLRVPARFWLMSMLCLAVVAGIVVAEFVRGRSRRVALITVLITGPAVLSDGWVDRLGIAALPGPVPGADLLRGATVFDVPPDNIGRDIAAVFRAVDGGWKAVNGYSGWGPSYYWALVAAGRAEADDLLTPFQRFGDLHVLVGVDTPRLQALVEHQAGATVLAQNQSLVLYKLPRRDSARSRPAGQRVAVRELRSQCSAIDLSKAIDGDEETFWQCGLFDDRQALTLDLGDTRTVGAIVHSLGSQYWLSPLALSAETSSDGTTWSPAWSGNVLSQAIQGGMDDPRHLRIVLTFTPREARFVRLMAKPLDRQVPWSIAELQLWSASQTH